MSNFEIEVKILLWEEENANKLIEKIHQADENTKLKDQNKQLNHYFLAEWNFEKLEEMLSTYIHDDHKPHLWKILKQGKKHSIRTRDADGKVLFVVKATIDDTTSENGTARLEFEAPVQGLSIHELDELILGTGFPYQSKWSRQRREYTYKEYTVCIDKNAWYGYVAEFEKIIDDKDKAEETKEAIRKELEALGVKELPQDRLERMFSHYNAHWPEYYGTDKTFIIE